MRNGVHHPTDSPDPWPITALHPVRPPGAEPRIGAGPGETSWVNSRLAAGVIVQGPDASLITAKFKLSGRILPRLLQSCHREGRHCCNGIGQAIRA
jgi:hypothetical protein